MVEEERKRGERAGNHRPAGWDSDGDGMPNEWETREGLNPDDGADGAPDSDGDGYTDLEDYLNWLAAGSPVLSSPQSTAPGATGAAAAEGNQNEPERPCARFERPTTRDDRIEVFGVLELVLPPGVRGPEKPEARLVVENQSLTGHVTLDRTVRFRFSPKAAKPYRFTIRSNVRALDGKTGGVTACTPTADGARRACEKYRNWWTDDPASEPWDDLRHARYAMAKNSTGASTNPWGQVTPAAVRGCCPSRPRVAHRRVPSHRVSLAERLPKLEPWRDSDTRTSLAPDMQQSGAAIA